MLEHRHTKRVAVSDTVSVYHRGTLVTQCDIKDISTDGIAIWAGPLQYYRNTMLEVEINAPVAKAPATKAPAISQSNGVRLAAMVVYSQDKVLGLMFGHVNETAKAFLRQYIDNATDVNSVAGSDDENTVWDAELKTRRAF
jgi:hypothetical protein